MFRGCGSGIVFFLFGAHQHADTANDQQCANAAEQESAEATGNGEIKALLVVDSNTCVISFLIYIKSSNVNLRRNSSLLACVINLRFVGLLCDRIADIQVNLDGVLQQIILLGLPFSV